MDKYKCPYDTCSKEYSDSWRLRSHQTLKHPSVDALGIILALLLFFISLGYSIYQNYQSSKTIYELKTELNGTKNQLDIVRSDVKNTTLSAKDELLFAIFEINSLGIKQKDEYFYKGFNLSYQQAVDILTYSKSTNDVDLAYNSLFYGAYKTSLHHFNLALIKESNNMQLKIGKAASLNGLNRTVEAREIFFKIQNATENQKFIYKLLGDSYCIEGDYSKCADYYLLSLEGYLGPKPPYDIQSLYLSNELCVMKLRGLSTEKVFIRDFGESKFWCEIKLTNYTIVASNLIPPK